ncbi:hypothetical protein FB451DRAFT_1276952 [Mycena latifolia]|nr:hypothetical protein FB451DRAFT_1276952 [Mycena latifolia]
MSSYSFAPPGETAADLWVERSNFDGNLITGVGYGVLFTITFETLSLFLKLERGKIPWGLVVYVSIMFALATLGMAGNAAFNQMVFVDNRDFPGGPNAFTGAYYSTWVNMMAFTAYIVMNWMASALVLWRFTMFWGTNFWLSLIPLLMFLGSVASSILFLLSIAVPTITTLVTLSVEFGIAYWSLSLGLNVLLSLSIATRILRIRATIIQLVGPGHASQYISIAAMLVESAALYAVSGVAFLICFARNTPLQNVLIGILGQVQGIAPVLIVFRVAQGRAWSTHTVHTLQRTQTVSSAPIGPFSIGSNRLAFSEDGSIDAGDSEHGAETESSTERDGASVKSELADTATSETADDARGDTEEGAPMETVGAPVSVWGS